MVIVIEDGLDDLKAYFKNRGYNIADKSYRGGIDAYIFEKNGIAGADNYNFSMIQSELKGGVLMVNAKNKTLFEIETILKNRIYGDILNFL